MDKNYCKNEKEGLCLYVKVIPSSPKNEILRPHDNFLKIKIRRPPEKGKANKELISYLSKIFAIPKKNILLLQGESSRTKKILLKGISLGEVGEIIRRHVKYSG